KVRPWLPPRCWRASRTTPGCTRAVRRAASTSMIVLRCFEVSMITPEFVAWPARLVPPPRMVMCAPCRRQAWTAATTSSTSRGRTTPSGTWRKFDASVDQAARAPRSKRTSPLTASRSVASSAAASVTQHGLVHADLAGLRDTSRPQPHPLGRPRQHGGVSHGAAPLVVVEEGEGVGVRPPYLRQPAGPARQGGAAVTRPWGGTPLVQPEVGPVGRAPQRGPQPGAIGQTERRPLAGEHLGGLVGEPRLVAQLHRDAHGG